jgi:hypothetical protein
MRLRSRKLALLFVVAGTAMAASPMAVAFADEADGGGVGTFRVYGDAHGIGVMLEQPASPTTPVPAAGLVPDAYAELSSGPAGLALSSVAWPGPLVGSAGTLAAVVAGVPPDIANIGNDPIKAQAQASGGGRDEQTLGPMYALVDGAKSQARTAITDFSSPGAVSAAKVFSQTRTFQDDAGNVTSIAESQINGLEIGGVLRIETVKMVAQGTTFGDRTEMTQKTTVSGVTVEDQACTIDETGMHCGGNDSDNPMNPIAEGANQILTNMGMTAYVTKPAVHKSTGGDGDIRTGTLVVFWQMDEATNTVFTIGGANITLRAQPGFGGGLSEVGGFDSIAGGATGSLDGFSSGGSFDSGGSYSPSISGGSSGRTSGGSGEVAAPVIALGGAEPISDRVPFGWMLVGFVGALMLASGLHGLRTKALEGALLSSACPLDSERGAS